MRLKKFFSLFIVLGIIGIPSVLANNDAKNIALDYISEFENFGPFWNSRNPKIVSETPFFTYDDINPSYIEYKVSCNDDNDCGFVLVNIDGTDVSVPMASTSGKTLSEQMGYNGSSKNFYFDIFNQFSISNSGKISSISPENNSIDNGNNIYSRSIDKNPLYEKFLDLQKNANDNKENNLKRQEFSKYSTRSITPAITKDGGLAHNEFFSKTMCKSITPCYYQFEREYTKGKNGELLSTPITNVTGCTPTAISILFGFYDKYGYPNIIEGTAPGRGNNKIKQLQIELGNLMGTYSNKDGGATDRNRTLDGFKYLDGIYNYGGVKIKYNDKNFWKVIKNEINSGRPLLMDYDSNKGGGHIVVIHGYSSDKLVINFGWGYEHANQIVDVNGNTFSGKSDSGEFANLYNFYLK